MIPKKRFAEYNASRLPTARHSVCHAPSVSLNFDQTGNVTACCYNRTFLLGSYPKQSIGEIWAGEAVRELRQRLKESDLSRGCGICADQLVTGNYAGTLARNFDLYVDGADNESLWPRVMEFELSNVCNLECIMCTGHFSSLIRRNREGLPPLPNPYDAAFVEQLKPFLPRLQTARFLGGEPFLNSLYYPIWEELARTNKSIQPSITTNGTVYDEKVERVLEELKPHLVVSIDSLDANRYEAIRQRSSFDKVRANLDRFLAFAKKHQRTVTIAVCPMPANWMDLPGIVKFCNETAARVYFNTVVWPPEHALKNLPPAELGRIARFLEDAAVSNGWRNPERVENLSERPRESVGTYLSLVRQVRSWAMQSESPRPEAQA